MALVVEIGITAGNRIQPIETVEIRRLEDLADPRHPDNETHPYAVTAYVENVKVATAEITHRYGDGARVCVKRALDALWADPREEQNP